MKALYVAAREKLQEEQYELIAHYRKTFFNILNDAVLAPFSNQDSSVFTIVPPQSIAPQFINNMTKQNWVLSYESSYLKERKWCQLATFGYYTERQLKQVSNALVKSKFPH